MTKEESLMFVQSMQPDRFFSATQQQQLTRLMVKWRKRCDQDESLPTNFQAELEALVEAELLAAAARTTSVLDDPTP